MQEKLISVEEPLSTKATINQFEAKMLAAKNELNGHIQDAEATVEALNFQSDAIDHVYAKSNLRDTKAEYQPQLDVLGEEWNSYGGARVDAAKLAVEALNFKSDALDHVAAKKELQSAEDAWVGSYRAAQVVDKDMPNTDPIDIDANTTPDLPQSTPETTPRAVEAIQARIDYHVGLTELHEKARALAELRAKGQQNSAVFKEITGSFDAEFNEAQKWLTVNQKDNDVFAYIKNIATGAAVSAKTAPERKSAFGAAKIPTLENLFLSAVPTETAEPLTGKDSSKDKAVEVKAGQEVKAEKVSIWKRLSEKAARLRQKASDTFGKSAPAYDRAVPFQDKVSVSSETPRIFEARVDHVFKSRLLGRVAILILSKSN
jgi:hypothetical protein